MRSHKNEFDQWVSVRNIEVFKRLSDVTNDFKTDLAVGQSCTFTNQYGIEFEGVTIMGFCKRQNNTFTGEDTGRYVYLDYDCYWLPAKLESIRLDESA